jgi:hypothetical protein
VQELFLFNMEVGKMRELSKSEVSLVSGGANYDTMDAGCFFANIYLGLSPFGGPVMIYGAVFSWLGACHEYIFDN